MSIWTRYPLPIDSGRLPLNPSQVLDLYHGGLTFERTLRKLQRICVARTLLPSSHVLLSEALNTDEYPFSSGGFSDVYRGTCDGLKVCVKKLRVVSPTSLDTAATKGSNCRYHCRLHCLLTTLTDALPGSFDVEATDTPQHRPIQRRDYQPPPDCVGVDVWRRLDDSHQFEPGHKSGCTREPPCAPSLHFALIFHQLIDVANGIDYLHSYGVIHGDLKGVSTHNYSLSGLPHKCSAAEYPRGCLWPRAYYGFWPCSGQQR